MSVKITEEYFLNRLQNSSALSSSLSNLSEKQYQHAQHILKSYAKKISDTFLPIVEGLENDKEYARIFQKELLEASSDTNRVLTNVSGTHNG